MKECTSRALIWSCREPSRMTSTLKHVQSSKAMCTLMTHVCTQLLGSSALLGEQLFKRFNTLPEPQHLPHQSNIRRQRKQKVNTLRCPGRSGPRRPASWVWADCCYCCQGAPLNLDHLRNLLLICPGRMSSCCVESAADD